MRLHENKERFALAIRATAQELDIPENFVEKDYWICQILQRLSSVVDSPLLSDFENIWGKISSVYRREVGALSYGEIPSEESISNSMKKLIAIIKTHFS